MAFTILRSLARVSLCEHQRALRCSTSADVHYTARSDSSGNARVREISRLHGQNQSAWPLHTKYTLFSLAQWTVFMIRQVCPLDNSICLCVTYTGLGLRSEAANLCLTVTAVARSKAWTVFGHPKARIVGLNPTQGMDICLRLFCVCIGSGLATGRSPVQGVLPNVLGLRNWSETKRFTDSLCTKWE
jgi:hypothetical protein